LVLLAAQVEHQGKKSMSYVHEDVYQDSKSDSDEETDEDDEFSTNKLVTSDGLPFIEVIYFFYSPDNPQ